MKFLFALLIGAVWSFYATLLMDRPDMAATIHDPYPMILHGIFALVLLRTVWGVSAVEISLSKRPILGAPGVWLRNLIVLALGLALMVFTWHELLHDIDPSGVHRLW